MVRRPATHEDELLGEFDLTGVTVGLGLTLTGPDAPWWEGPLEVFDEVKAYAGVPQRDQFGSPLR